LPRPPLGRAPLARLQRRGLGDHGGCRRGPAARVEEPRLGVCPGSHGERGERAGERERQAQRRPTRCGARDARRELAAAGGRSERAARSPRIVRRSHHDYPDELLVRRLTLKPGREGPVRGGHPWIFSGAIAAGLEGVEPGEPVHVHAAGGRFLAGGYVNPRTPIAVRVLTLEEEAIDAALVRRRLDEALALRQATLPAGLLDAYRVLNGEGDRLPGVAVDRYGAFLVCQFLTAGAARLAPAVVEGLGERLAPRGIFERSEGSVRTEEGLPGARGVLAGEAPPARLRIAEDGACFLVDVLHGQKTGFFLDQRESRARVRALAAGRRVLNAFAYTGAIGIAAALGGAAEVVSVDTSRSALALAEEAWAANGLPTAA